jgi:hypothetical protein
VQKGVAFALAPPRQKPRSSFEMMMGWGYNHLKP